MNLGDTIRNSMSSFTAAERKAATALLADYPFAGLLTLAELAKRSHVSSQTILRLGSKLGFDGFGELQKTLLGELKESYQSPIILHDRRGDGKTGDAFLANLAEASIEAMRRTVALVPDEQLDAVSALLSDQRRSIFLLGGRATDSLALYLFFHLRQIRPKVYKVPRSPEEWPEYLLRIRKNDIVIMIDYRRYQVDLQTFAKCAARDRGAQIVLITDTWLSPIAKHSTHVLPSVIDVGTPWDTGTSAMLLIEGLISKVSEVDWPRTRKRIEAWEALRMQPSVSERESED